MVLTMTVTLIENSTSSKRALYSSQQIKKIEKAFSESIGKSTYLLMERAGKVIFNNLLSRWPKARKILIVTGKGNNAGDGFIVARLAAKKKIEVTLWSLAKDSLITGDAKIALEKLPQNIHRIKTDNTHNNFCEDILTEQSEPFDLIIDAILGTGVKGPVRQPFLSAVKAINQNQASVLSIDIPSGVEADTGAVHNHAIKSDLTITFVGIKKGLLTGDAANYIGQLILDKLDIPENFYPSKSQNIPSLTWKSIRKILQPRPEVCHKGCFGHVLLIGGNKGYAGAAVLSTKASARSGAGLTSALVDIDSVIPILNHTPEVMANAVKFEQIDTLFNNKKLTNKTIVFGPGLGTDKWSKKWFENLQSNKELANQFQVWDADALNLLSQQPNLCHNRILTPHPGEASRLLNTDIKTINNNRFKAASQIAKIYGGICVLKGVGTIISDEQGNQVVCPVGNPGMATGGMGDILAGLIGGLLAQGYSMIDSAILGVCIHGEAADLAAGSKEQYRGMLATDLIEHFQSLLNPDID